ncbi:unnamed protein product, partial [Prorocentrum cordatum]
ASEEGAQPREAGRCNPRRGVPCAPRPAPRRRLGLRLRCRPCGRPEDAAVAPGAPARGADRRCCQGRRRAAAQVPAGRLVLGRRRTGEGRGPRRGGRRGGGGPSPSALRDPQSTGEARALGCRGGGARPWCGDDAGGQGGARPAAGPRRDPPQHAACQGPPRSRDGRLRGRGAARRPDPPAGPGPRPGAQREPGARGLRRGPSGQRWRPRPVRRGGCPRQAAEAAAQSRGGRGSELGLRAAPGAGWAHAGARSRAAREDARDLRGPRVPGPADAALPAAEGRPLQHQGHRLPVRRGLQAARDRGRLPRRRAGLRPDVPCRPPAGLRSHGRPRDSAQIEYLLWVPLGSWFGLARRAGAAELGLPGARGLAKALHGRCRRPEVLAQLRQATAADELGGTAAPASARRAPLPRALRSWHGLGRHGELDPEELKRQVWWGATADVMVEFGFDWDVAGYQQMCAALARYRDDAVVHYALASVERIFSWPSGTLFSGEGEYEAAPATNAAAAVCMRGSTVRVLVRHALNKTEICIAVAATSTMRDVRQAVACQLGRSDVVEAGRLVRPTGRAFVSYRDGEPLGRRRRLLFLGPDLAAARPPAVAVLPLQRAQHLMQELARICSGADFQRQVDAAHRSRRDEPTIKKIKGFLFVAECGKALESVGISGDRAGFCLMFGAVYELRSDPQVASLAREVEGSLRVKPGSWLCFPEAEGSESRELLAQEALVLARGTSAWSDPPSTRSRARARDPGRRCGPGDAVADGPRVLAGPPQRSARAVDREGARTSPRGGTARPAGAGAVAAEHMARAEARRPGEAGPERRSARPRVEAGGGPGEPQAAAAATSQPWAAGAKGELREPRGQAPRGQRAGAGAESPAGGALDGRSQRADERGRHDCADSPVGRGGATGVGSDGEGFERILSGSADSIDSSGAGRKGHRAGHDVPLWEGFAPVERLPRARERALQGWLLLSEDAQDAVPQADSGSGSRAASESTDSDLEEASRVIQEVTGQLVGLAEQLVVSPARQKREILARKRELVNSARYQAALRCIAQPQDSRSSAQLCDAAVAVTRKQLPRPKEGSDG